MEISENSYSRRQKTGLFLGPFLFLFLLALPVPQSMSPEAWRTAAIALFMAVWWMTEPIPIPATALLPMVLLPFFGISKMQEAAQPYAHPLVYLFMGGFILALGMREWNLHKRIALLVIKKIGTGPKQIIAGFMIAAAFLSMWVSNTATTMMMLPIALPIIELAQSSEKGQEKQLENFAIALLLGIAYACSIGGIGTLIGTPPNAFLASFLDQTYHIQIGFGQWMLIGMPVVILGLPLVYFIMTRFLFKIDLMELGMGKKVIDEELRHLGPVSRQEKIVAFVFALVAISWIFRPVINKWLPGVSDTGIGMAGAVLLFIIPVDLRKGRFLLQWHAMRDLPWGVLILFGGGLSLANAIAHTGLAEWIGNQLQFLQFLPVVFFIFLITTVIVFLTELTSNTATAAAFLPIMASVAVAISQSPLLLVLPAAMSASCAFMLPVATPPNAIVYGSGKVSINNMMQAGIWLNILFIFLITALVYVLSPFVFGFAIN
ncbi:MAG: DASS family sodium-coupled anion symporter [Deferribacteres bacterium]|nr:DASS family sodium-coupled anion symporter [candidate division KSB1 bacterium]MCB9502542.1 DASS family sodium-coupled anion symporter [Deferribacteres bacterium]